MVKDTSFNLEQVTESGITIIPEYLEIQKLIAAKEPTIFVTGGAGTGKSTFIKWVMEEFEGKILLGAPTAIAALNIGAKTLHSLCYLPPSWILEEDIKEAYRKKEIKKARILIIDEISMVNPNLLDGVDSFFRLNRRIDKPFGGLITIMVGDLFQLPAIVTKETQALFDEFYDSVKFYSAYCFEGQHPKTVELTKTFRQKDNVFIDILLNIRRGNNVYESISILNEECEITYTPTAEGVVRLSPRNIEVQNHNMAKLNKINSPKRRYVGEISGKFSTSALPSPMNLELKEGAQVMFTQNDSGGEREWINGTVGIVTKMEDDVITVEIINSPEYNGIVKVQRTVWSNYNHVWNERTSHIEREKAGSYEQFPLILAWAVTIHKSQGRTIDHVHLDLGKGAFETGQTYVALSRCPTMKGISLSRPIREEDILVDHEVRKFMRDIHKS